MGLLRSWYRTVKIGMLSTMKMLNRRQRLHFFWMFICGKTLKEFKIKGGEKYPNITFFIIRRDYSKVGLFSMYNTNAGYIKYALDKGYIPVVDMQHYSNCYLEASDFGNKNSWEFYFKQPTTYSLREAYQGKNVIVSNIGICEIRPNDHMSYFNNINGELEVWRRIAKENIIIKEDIWDEAKRKYLAATNGERTLAVSIRGTDYIKLEPPEHPIQPSMRQVLNDVRKIFNEEKCKYVYLCTEDSKIIAYFKENLGNKCFINERRLVDYKDGSIIEKTINEKANRYEDGKQYLITMLILVFADVLIASRASGTVAMEMISDGWDKQVIYNLGRYPQKEGKKG